MIEFQNVSYVTAEEKTILSDVSIQIDDRFVAITGPNGSGKSTMAKLIAGIYTPTAGRIFLDGEDITELTNEIMATAGAFAQRKGVVFA